jgi:hypothetical protein
LVAILTILPASHAGAHSVAFGAYVPGSSTDPTALDRFSAQATRSPAIVVYYQSWSEPALYQSQLRAAAQRGAVPMVTWEPWDASLRGIAAGRHDAYIRASARDATAYGGPIMLRFAHEMNGGWTPWGAGVGGNTAADYVKAWRHVVSIFRQQGADNVRWVWSPNVNDSGKMPFERFYPGDPWVNWVALDGYNAGATYGGWWSFRQVFASSYRALKQLTSKPMMVAETASNEAGGDKAAWIRKALGCQLPTDFPRIRALVWFDQRTPDGNWPIDSSRAALDAFRKAIQSPTFGLGSKALLGGLRGEPDPSCIAGGVRIHRAQLLTRRRGIEVDARSAADGSFRATVGVTKARNGRLLGRSRVTIRPSSNLRLHVRAHPRRWARARHELSRHRSMRVRVDVRSRGRSFGHAARLVRR